KNIYDGRLPKTFNFQKAKRLEYERKRKKKDNLGEFKFTYLAQLKKVINPYPHDKKRPRYRHIINLNTSDERKNTMMRQFLKNYFERKVFPHNVN
ncbi:MAG: hypothetical protein ACR2HS_03370, partial [Gammaproteobacteria bacterium]